MVLLIALLAPIQQGPQSTASESGQISESAQKTKEAAEAYEKWLYHTYEWATIAGVIGGWVVLGIIWRQTQSMTKAERAWIMVDVRTPVKPSDHRQLVQERARQETPETSPTIETFVNVVLFCQNQGRTPAWILEQHIRCEIFDPGNVPTKPDFGAHFQVEKGIRVAPVGIEIPHRYTLFVPGKCAERQVILVYGFVKYRDIFRKEHTSVFGSFIFSKNLLAPVTDLFDAYHKTT